MVVFPFFHPYVSFFFFPLVFSLVFSTPHTYTHISHPLLFFFFLYFRLPEPPSLFLSPALSFSNLFLFFSFSTIIFKHTQTHMERKEKSPLLHHTATAAPPHRWCSTTHIRLYFFFLIFYCCSIFFSSVLDLLLFWF